MARYDDTFVDRFLEPWNRHDVDGALALMTDDCVWEVPEGVSRMAPSTPGRRPSARRSWRRLRRSPTSITNPFGILSARTIVRWATRFRVAPLRLTNP